MHKIIFIDNQDSFSYNLVEELKRLAYPVDVYRNTVAPDYIISKIEEAQRNNLQPLLFLSPGPGKPEGSPCMMALLKKCVGRIPIIGVCLGHQAIAQHLGGTVAIAGETVHGKSSEISLNQHPIFDNLGNVLRVARYHSLVVEDLPDELKVIASFNGLTMAVINESVKVLGFQFHPESILTTHGAMLLKQSLEYLFEKTKGA